MVEPLKGEATPAGHHKVTGGSAGDCLPSPSPLSHTCHRRGPQWRKSPSPTYLIPTYPTSQLTVQPQPGHTHPGHILSSLLTANYGVFHPIQPLQSSWIGSKYDTINDVFAIYYTLHLGFSNFDACRSEKYKYDMINGIFAIYFKLASWPPTVASMLVHVTQHMSMTLQ